MDPRTRRLSKQSTQETVAKVPTKVPTASAVEPRGRKAVAIPAIPQAIPEERDLLLAVRSRPATFPMVGCEDSPFGVHVSTIQAVGALAVGTLAVVALTVKLAHRTAAEPGVPHISTQNEPP